MKSILSFALLLALSLPSFASTSPSRDQIADWVKPLVGNHALKGDAGCGDIAVREWPYEKGVYEVTIGSDSLATVALYYNTEVSISGSELKYSSTTHAGVFGWGQWNKDVVRIRKAADGSLKTLQLKRSTGYGPFSSGNVMVKISCRP